MSTPLCKLDVLTPKKKLMEKMGIPWEDKYNDFKTFRNRTLDWLNANAMYKEIMDEYKKMKEKMPNYSDPRLDWFYGTTSCGVYQLHGISDIFVPELLTVRLAYGVCTYAPNFKYWGGETAYANSFKMLDEMGWQCVMRSWNLVHNHYCLEYAASYDVPDDRDYKHPDEGKYDEIAYAGYSSTLRNGNKSRRGPYGAGALRTTANDPQKW